MERVIARSERRRAFGARCDSEALAIRRVSHHDGIELAIEVIFLPVAVDGHDGDEIV
jgi:hypothetical protein